MNATISQKEMVVLVADLDAENTIRGLLHRPESLRIRPLREDEFSVLRHPDRDNRFRRDAVDFIRSSLATHRRALVIFDHHGSGAEEEAAEEIERSIEADLSRNGWNENCSCIVLEPELEAWIWSDSPQVASELGWPRQSRLWAWMIDRRYVESRGQKPLDPKDAFLAALKEVHKRYSARIFYNVANRVTLNRCQDRAFLKFKSVMRQWFG